MSWREGGRIWVIGVWTNAIEHPGADLCWWPDEMLVGLKLEHKKWTRHATNLAKLDGFDHVGPTVPGAAPIIVLSEDGTTEYLATSIPPSRAIDIYEQPITLSTVTENIVCHARRSLLIGDAVAFPVPQTLQLGRASGRATSRRSPRRSIPTSSRTRCAF